MKYIILSFFSILCSLNIYAQETTDESLKIDAAFDACIAMRDAVAANDTTALLQSAKELKEAGTELIRVPGGLTPFIPEGMRLIANFGMSGTGYFVVPETTEETET